MVRYLIVGYSRSGTTALHMALSGHPDVCTLEGELKPTPFFSNGILTFTHDHAGEMELENGHRAIFDAIASIRHKDAKVLGAKTACNSPAAAQQMVEVLRTRLPEFKIIHAVRKDVVAHCGSGLVAGKTGIYHSWQKSHKEKPRIRIPKYRLTLFARHVAALNAVFSSLRDSHDYLKIDNEEYTESPETVHESLFNFIGVENVPVTWQSEKVLPPPESYITNYKRCQEWLTTIHDPSKLLAARIMSRAMRAIGRR